MISTFHYNGLREKNQVVSQVFIRFFVFCREAARLDKTILEAPAGIDLFFSPSAVQ